MQKAIRAQEGTTEEWETSIRQGTETATSKQTRKYMYRSCKINGACYGQCVRVVEYIGGERNVSRIVKTRVKSTKDWKQIRQNKDDQRS